MFKWVQIHVQTVFSRSYSLVHPLEQELDFSLPGTYLFSLPHLTVIEITGENAHSFLQGQLTCNVMQLQDQEVLTGALCNLKGRILALPDLVNHHGLKLILAQDLVPDTLRALNTPALLSKIRLRVVEDFTLFGLYQGDSSLKPLENVNIYKKNSGLAYILTAEPSSLWNQFSPTFQRSSLAWHHLQLRNNRMEIYPSSRGLFLPHYLGLHLSEIISFTKGCYKGQEIIARMQYKGKLKYTLEQRILDFIPTTGPGEMLYTVYHQPIGELIDYCPLASEKALCLLTVPLDAAA